VKQLDTLLKSDKATLALEATGDGKVRVNCQSWEHARVILADEALQVVAFRKSLVVARGEQPAEYLNIDPTEMPGVGSTMHVLSIG
jgi:hypothetical protein